MVTLDLMYLNIYGIDLCDDNAGKVCSEVRLRCTWKSLVLTYLSKIHVRIGVKLNTDVHGYQWYSFN